MTDLDHYIHHAERFGVAEIYETACRDLNVVDLGRLAHRLQHIDPKWHLDREQRARLALDLHEAGVEPRQVCDQAGISRPTLRKVLDHAKQAPEPAF